MFPSLLRLSKSSQRHEALRIMTPSPGPAYRDYAQQRHATADFTEADDDDDDDDFLGAGMDADDGADVSHGEENEDGIRDSTFLPLFSASHLGRLRSVLDMSCHCS